MNVNDYLGLIGFSGLSLGLGFAVIGLFTGAYFLLKKELSFGWLFRIILLIQFICIAIAVFSLCGLLLNNAFEYPLVFDAVEKSMPWFQKLSGLWSGQSSSLLFWSFILSLVIFQLSRSLRKSTDEYFSALVAVILGIALVFFLAPVLILSNPFEKLWQLADGSTLEAVFAPQGAGLIVPVDGVGMNPSLRHIAMLLHPPFLYIGLVGFFVPYAISLAWLIRGGQEKQWIKSLLPITMAAWISLTLGMVLGSWWAYTILGWGGYWGWDAVEIAGLLPWLLSFGLIHSLRMQQSGKNYVRWIVVFSGLIFISILSGILITRSGILESVHAYSTGVMGPILSVFIGINVIIYGFFVFRRWGILEKTNWSKLTLTDQIIRIFNFLILGLVMLFFIGQTYPLTSQLLTGAQITWKADQYELFSSPFLFLVLIVTAICPLSSLYEREKQKFWRKIIIVLILALIPAIILTWKRDLAIHEFLGFWAVLFLIAAWLDQLVSPIFFFRMKKHHDKKEKNTNFGSILIHIGLGLMALGILGQETLSESYDVKMAEGEKIHLGDYQINLLNSSREISSAGTTFSSVDIEIGEFQQDAFMLKPDLEYYPKMKMLYARPALPQT